MNAFPISLQTAPLLAASNVFMTLVPFAMFFMQQPLRLDFLWAGLCLVGAVYHFIFRA
jgi:uncharacterized protein